MTAMVPALDSSLLQAPLRGEAPRRTRADPKNMRNLLTLHDTVAQNVVIAVTLSAARLFVMHDTEDSRSYVRGRRSSGERRAKSDLESVWLQDRA